MMQQLKKWGVWLVVAAVAMILAWMLGVPAPIPPLPLDSLGPNNLGWVNHPEAVAKVAATLRFKSFSATPAGQEADDKSDVFLWQAAKAIGKPYLPGRNQGQVGSCVGFGTTTAVEYTILSQIANKKGGTFHDLVQEATYGLSRYEIGWLKYRSPANGGDGSVGAWAAEAVRDYGMLARGKIDSFDLSAYSEKLCRDWGRNGLPNTLEPLAKKSPVKNITLVKTAVEARAALHNGYAIAVCSGQGFSMQRDADGFCRASGSWAHCMCICGYQGGNRPGFFIINSWGDNAHTGPPGKGSPPPCGFWAEEAVVARMLGAGDSWAFSDAVGFPSRKLDWIVRNRMPDLKQRNLFEPLFGMAP